MKTKLFQVGKSYKGKSEVRGIDFTVIRRSGDVVLLERSDNVYEVIRIQHVEPTTINLGGKEITIEKGEKIPSGENWNGKCVTKLCRALEIFNNYTNENK